jgi:peroxiredoxin
MTSTSSPSLADRYAALHAEREASWPAEKLRGNIAQREALVAAFDPSRVVQVGDAVGPFPLGLDDGRVVTLHDLTRDGPVALIFFRFAGCPACNLALPYYDEALRPGLDALGIRILAVSPHLPETGFGEIRTRHGLGFDVASDRGNALARHFGLTFLPLGDPPAPADDPNWIGALTGTGTWELPQPAVILVDRTHVVRFVDVSPDWMKRSEAEPVLAAARALADRSLAA